MNKQLMKDLRDIDWGAFDLQADLAIDKHSLDIAAVQQPILMAKWSTTLAKASAERDKAKEALGVMEANLQGKARAGTEKLTEAAVKAWVRSHVDYRKSSKALRVTERNVSYLTAAVRAIDAKKYMIQELDKLFISGYYAETNIHTATEKASQKQRSSNAQERLNNKMQKRKNTNTGE